MIGLRKIDLTDESIQKLVDKYNDYAVKHEADGAYPIELEEYTCNSCIDKYRCDCSFDPYNTGGDCLYGK